MKSEIKELVQISHFVGVHPDLIQGGGGNTSVKVDNETMLIKASGYCLKDMTEIDGFSVVDYAKIVEKISKYKFDGTLDEFIKDQSKRITPFPKRKPSIETGFHALLRKYVIHDHSSYANIITCSKEGPDLSKKLFPSSIWVRYQAPGEPLTIELKHEYEKHSAKVIFLENHGLIVNADDIEEVKNLHNKVNSVIKDNFKLDQYYSEKSMDIDFIRKNVLFPDQVVFTFNKETLKSQAAKETITSYCYILNQINKNNLTANFLSKEDADFINDMESEKYRRGLVK